MAQLPALSFNPQNALIDFSPVTNALENNRRNALMQQQNDRADRQMQMQEDEFSYRRGRDQKQDARQEVEWYGKQAMAVDQMPDGPQRQAVWQRIVQKHGADGLTPEEMDHRTGPKIMAAQAGQFLNPIDKQIDEAKLGLLRAQTSAANQRVDQSKVMEVNGRLVRVPQSGPAEEIYNAGPGASKLPGAVQTDGIKASQAYDNLIPALDNYKKLVATTGAVALPGQDKDAVIQARRNIQLQLKELYNLGVLNGPDLELMDRMVFDPSVNLLNPFDYSNAYDTANRGTHSIDQLKDMLRNIRNNKTKVLGIPDVPEPQNAPAQNEPQSALPQRPGFKYIGRAG